MQQANSFIVLNIREYLENGNKSSGTLHPSMMLRFPLWNVVRPCLENKDGLRNHGVSVDYLLNPTDIRDISNDVKKLLRELHKDK